ncbi:histidine phosphatase family protein [Acidipropionibacterium virtanenii]|uniref:Phosphoserine phosphatase 2 n=1 Tax=Acidipropionibacterium virtanenii TaxID=2057246 RepID=A0A344UWF1_9ACTN|nr:histidine phosphatase family protein [Acidipropionibacterium virtanenii]AXE39599.1 Putative phosphoserine phosphatase 2 [Acidipropionibacterium virtanenii]
MTLLVLVRHGQSTWNLEHRLQGQRMDVPLTPLGRRQADQAARRVKALVPPATPVYSSDQDRALQTAAPIAAALTVQPRPDPRLREQDLGRMEGLLPEQLTPEPAPEGVDIADVRWGGGESLADVAARLRSFLSDLAAAEDGRSPARAVIVSHGDTLRVLLALLDGRTHRECNFDLVLGNGEVITRDADPAQVA